jgi:hypothetical protein
MTVSHLVTLCVVAAGVFLQRFEICLEAESVKLSLRLEAFGYIQRDGDKKSNKTSEIQEDWRNRYNYGTSIKYVYRPTKTIVFFLLSLSGRIHSGQAQNGVHETVIVDLHPAVSIRVQLLERLAELFDDDAASDESVEWDSRSAGRTARTWGHSVAHAVLVLGLCSAFNILPRGAREVRWVAIQEILKEKKSEK